MKIFANNVEKGPYFAGTYGLLSKCMTVVTFDGKLKKVFLDGNDTKGTYFTLSESQKDMVRQLVLICDNFSISDSGYREILMTVPEVPRLGILLE